MIEILSLMVTLIGALVMRLLSRQFPELHQLLLRLIQVLLQWFPALKRLQRREPQTYGQKLASLAANLGAASAEVDSLMTEIRDISGQRQAALERLEAELKSRESEEQALRKRINELRDIPLPVAEHFARLTEAGERRSARRDYYLFGLGVVVSMAVSVALKWLGVA